MKKMNYKWIICLLVANWFIASNGELKGDSFPQKDGDIAFRYKIVIEPIIQQGNKFFPSVPEIHGWFSFYELGGSHIKIDERNVDKYINIKVFQIHDMEAPVSFGLFGNSPYFNRHTDSPRAISFKIDISSLTPGDYAICFTIFTNNWNGRVTVPEAPFLAPRDEIRNRIEGFGKNPNREDLELFMRNFAQKDVMRLREGELTVWDYFTIVEDDSVDPDHIRAVILNNKLFDGSFSLDYFYDNVKNVKDEYVLQNFLQIHNFLIDIDEFDARAFVVLLAKYFVDIDSLVQCFIRSFSHEEYFIKGYKDDWEKIYQRFLEIDEKAQIQFEPKLTNEQLKDGMKQILEFVEEFKTYQEQHRKWEEDEKLRIESKTLIDVEEN